MTQLEKNEHWFLASTIVLWSFFVIGLARFLFHALTAYTSLDMVPYLIHSLDPLTLSQDFLANASVSPSPRHIFGILILLLTKITHSDWYSAYFFLLSLLVVGLPVTIFFALSSIIRLRNLAKSSLLLADRFLAVAIMVAMIPPLSYLIPVGRWQIFDFTVSPHWLALLLGFMAIVTQRSTRLGHWRLPIALLLWVLATMLHPSIGIIMGAFVAILSVCLQPKLWRESLLVICLGIVIPMAMVALIFRSSTTISAIDFVRIYCINAHPAHYFMPAYHSLMAGIPWYCGLLSICLPLITVSILAWRRHQFWLLILALLSLFSYVGSLLLQYAGVAVWPTKIIATIGPARYTTVGYWLMVITVILWLIQQRWTATLTSWRLPAMQRKTFLLILLVAFFAMLLLKDNPILARTQAHDQLFTWMRTTPVDTVFAVPLDGLSIDVNVIANRSVFVGNGFPFNESSFIEYDERFSALYGNYESNKQFQGVKPEEKNAQYFANLKPEDIVAIIKKYRIDYLVVQKNHKYFERFTPVFQDDTYSVYQVRSLQ